MWVDECATAPRASAAAYFFSHCAHFHVFVSTSYLNVHLAFSPDSLGFLGLPLKWWLFSGCLVVVSSSVFSARVFFVSLLIVGFIVASSACHGFISWIPWCCCLFSGPASSLSVSFGLLWAGIVLLRSAHIYIAGVA